VLDAEHPNFGHLSGDGWLDAYLFTAPRQPIADVFVAGRHVVREGRHCERDAIELQYKRTLARIGQL
jgi:formimidoylglutamate deiminase